jgi:hypothetical protein
MLVSVLKYPLFEQHSPESGAARTWVVGDMSPAQSAQEGSVMTVIGGEQWQ